LAENLGAATKLTKKDRSLKPEKCLCARFLGTFELVLIRSKELLTGKITEGQRDNVLSKREEGGPVAL
jgi:hypothetical protein